MTFQVRAKTNVTRIWDETNRKIFKPMIFFLIFIKMTIYLIFFYKMHTKWVIFLKNVFKVNLNNKYRKRLFNNTVLLSEIRMIMLFC